MEQEGRGPAGRESFQSASGYVLAVVGIAIGLGNIWRFPYQIGMFGGGAWLIFFLIIVAVITLPALTAEWVLGRNTQSGPVGAFFKAGFPRGKLVGGIFSVAIYMALYYYLPVTTYVFMYIFASLFGLFANMPAADFYTQMSGNVLLVFVCQIVVLGLISWNLLYGVRGIEKASRYMTSLFFILMLLVGIRGLTLPGAIEGTREFLQMDWSQLTGAAMLTAMGQAFFSLSLGGTLMVTYSSYMSKKLSIPKMGAFTAFSDTLGAIFCFGVVVPAAFALSIPVGAGPRLLFITLPEMFTLMPAGMLFATLTFLAMYFVVHMSVMSGIEVISTVTMENYGWSRKRSVFTWCLLTLILSIPVLFSESFLIFSDLLWGSIMQPLGACFAMVAVGWFMGKSRALKELMLGSGKSVGEGLAVSAGTAANGGELQGQELEPSSISWIGHLWFFWVQYVIPAVVIIVLVYGLITW